MCPLLELARRLQCSRVQTSVEKVTTAHRAEEKTEGYVATAPPWAEGLAGPDMTDHE